MSGRPPGVKAGDRVRVTTVHTGIITRIDDDSFVLETGPGRPMHGNFHGNGEMTWEVQRPEPPVGTIVIDEDGLAWQRSNEFSATPWYAAAADEFDRSWDALNDDRGPLTVIYEGDAGADCG